MSSFEQLVELVAKLRAEDGCPWDRAQDHRSLRPYVLEEAYETIAAIDAGDNEALADELGDLLLQVLLHSQIASERGEFSIDDVSKGLAEKLTRRHPHVFGDAPSDLPSLRKRWEEIKSREKQKVVRLPVLLRARKAVSALGNLGRTDLIDEEKIGRTAEERAGARILAAIAASWQEGFDPELALQKAIDRLCEGTGE